MVNDGKYKLFKIKLLVCVYFEQFQEHTYFLCSNKREELVWHYIFDVFIFKKSLTKDTVKAERWWQISGNKTEVINVVTKTYSLSCIHNNLPQEGTVTKCRKWVGCLHLDGLLYDTLFIELHLLSQQMSSLIWSTEDTTRADGVQSHSPVCQSPLLYLEMCLLWISHMVTN